MNMDIIIILIIICSIYYILENKISNKLLAYISIILAIALLIGSDTRLIEVEGEYIKYILILIQVSGISILYGYVIMLNPPIYNIRLIIKGRKTKQRDIIIGIIYIIIITIIFIYLYREEIIKYILDLSNYIYINISPKSINYIERNIWEENIFLKKLGYALYNITLNIIKLMTIMLLLIIIIILIFLLF